LQGGWTVKGSLVVAPNRGDASSSGSGSGPTTVITGATDGLGLALARRLDVRGNRLVLVGRRPRHTLDDPLFDRHAYCEADLSRDDCGARLADFLKERRIADVDTLVHNAAIGYYGPASEQPPENLAEMLRTNLLAPITLTHALMGRLEAARGKVCFVSSVVSGLPGARYAAYTATKAALEGFARSLRLETRGRVGVQVIRPGAAHTGFHRKMGLERSVMDWGRFPSADRVAARMERALESGRRGVTLGAANKLVYGLGRLCPGLVDAVVRRKGGVEPLPAAAASRGRRLCAVTGAANGIGRALAHRFAEMGFDIVGVDCDARGAGIVREELRARGARATFVVADLGTPAGVDRALEELAQGPPLDLLVHSAGINAVGRFAALPLAEQEAVVAVNLAAPMRITAGLLRMGVLSPEGALVFVASLSCYTGYPGAAAYGASKDGLAAYARSLAAALGPQRHVLTLFPGPVRTAHAERYSPDNSRAAVRMPPRVLAEKTARALFRRRRTLVPGWKPKVGAALGRLWPGLMEYAMRKMILDKLDRRPGKGVESGR
jgi:short-subunit dehydrogenase